MNHYGITIGPILETLSLARKTRELWAGSYLFSYVMKQILMKLKAEGAEILLPYSDDTIDLGNGKVVNLFKGKYGAGIFPDRCVFRTDQEPEEINAFLGHIKKQLVEAVVSQSKRHQAALQTEEAMKYFESYFRIYLVHQEMPTTRPHKLVVKDMFDLLDAAELHPQMVTAETGPFLKQFLTTASFKAKTHSFLMADTTASGDRVRFESVIELAAGELLDEEDKASLFSQSEDDTMIKKLKTKYENRFKTHHKYVAVVHVDGDNFGQIIQTLKDNQYLQFSEALTRNSLLISEAIEDFGGLPVYIGGDDALFFAPLRSGSKTLLDLIDQIDELFNHQFANLISEAEKLDIPPPSLSVGISVSYYKYPLYEALEESKRQLFEVAKKTPRRDGTSKNAIAFRVRKHSGQQFAGVLFKESESYRQLKDLLKLNLEEESFLNSVIQFAGAQSTILEHIGVLPDRVSHFMEQQFNEDIHRNNPFLSQVQSLLPAVYNIYEPGVDPNGALNRANMLYGILRWVKFLNREEHD